MPKIIYKRQQHTVGGRQKNFFWGSDVLPHISGMAGSILTILPPKVLECRPLSNESIRNVLALIVFVLHFYMRQKQFFKKKQYFLTRLPGVTSTV